MYSSQIYLALVKSATACGSNRLGGLAGQGILHLLPIILFAPTFLSHKMKYYMQQPNAE